jgi:hypothetical protein
MAFQRDSVEYEGTSIFENLASIAQSKTKGDGQKGVRVSNESSIRAGLEVDSQPFKLTLSVYSLEPYGASSRLAAAILLMDNVDRKLTLHHLTS